MDVAGDAQMVNFPYPTALPAAEYEGMAYIRPRLKLERGARGNPWPTEEKVIRPYAADDYPDFFDDPNTSVTVLSARRTFWEKATALHVEAHRPAESPTPQYLSWHCCDLAMLQEIEEGQALPTSSCWRRWSSTRKPSSLRETIAADIAGAATEGFRGRLIARR